MDYAIEIKHVEAKPVAAVKFTATTAEMAGKFGAAFADIMQYATRAGAQIMGPAIGYYEQLGNDRFNVTAGFIVAGPIEGDGHVVPFELPACEVATVLHVGPYDTMQEAYAALMEQVKATGKEIDMTSPMWEEYLTGPEVPPDKTQTMICWPVKQ